MKIRFESDFSGAKEKMEAMKRFPKTSLYLLTKWASDTIKAIKTAGIFKSHPSGEIMRNIGLQEKGGEIPQVIIGTGVGHAKEVKYARIQEEGGTIKPKGHPFLTIPFPGVRGIARNYPNAFLATTAGGQWLLAEPKGKTGIRPLFLLRREVTLPATHWFSKPVKARLPILNEMLAPENLWQMSKLLGQK